MGGERNADFDSGSLAGSGTKDDLPVHEPHALTHSQKSKPGLVANGPHVETPAVIRNLEFDQAFTCAQFHTDE
jgi:hypothetical protein